MHSAAAFFVFGWIVGTHGCDRAIFAVGRCHRCDELFCRALIQLRITGGEWVPVYVDVLMGLNFLVDLLLLVGTNRLTGRGCGVRRAIPAAILGGVYGGVCILPGMEFLGGTVWRVVSLSLMAVIAFGVRQDALRRAVVFILLSMALGGVAVGLNSGSFWTVIFAAAAVCGMCLIGFRGKIGQRFVKVKVEKVEFTALIDTGNTLTDPMTGQPILVVSASVGEKLLHVDRMRLRDPVMAMEAVCGMRLIPFRAVGCSNGMLPVKRFENVQIGTWHGRCLIAFAPSEIGQGKGYEALTGGAL